jgi:hypothetical protein
MTQTAASDGVVRLAGRMFVMRAALAQPARVAPILVAAILVAALAVVPSGGRAEQTLTPALTGKLPPSRTYPGLVTPLPARPGAIAQGSDVPAAPAAESAASPADEAAPGEPPAQPAEPKPAPAAQTWLQRGNAVLQALDKVNAQTANLTVPVGQSATYGSLTIAVKGCVVRPPDQPQDAAAFLDISDSHADQPGFSGWVLRSAPSVSMLQHPIYDIRVVGCGA